MAINNPRIKYLYNQYLNDTANADELEEFWQLIAKTGQENSLEHQSEALYNSIKTESSDSEERQNILNKALAFCKNNFEANIPNDRITRRTLYWFRMAAIILILFGATAFFLRLNREIGNKSVVTKVAVEDVAPGGNKAILTLSNGTKILLDSTSNTGLLAVQDGAKIIKENDGQISYKNENVDNSIVYNTLTIPRGGQFKLVLSDGSKVWLNAASSIHYPIVFNKGDRKVEITGEAYFEIAHDSKRPFIVSARNTQVRVLGTHFNINAYDDEDKVLTTLIQGRVKISSSSSSGMLAPGQQATVEPYSGKMSVNTVDTDPIVAWVNGNLSLDNLRVKELMKQISRWYNVDIIYEANPQPGRFGGIIKRNVKLSTVINVMKESGIDATLEDGKIIIR